jgi:hypothetical protein
MYYFRLVEPDFTPMPVYDALKAHFHSDEARVLYPGVHQEDHWALAYDGPWETRPEASAELGMVRYAPDSSQATLTLSFEGTSLELKTGPGAGGTLALTLDGGGEQQIDFEGERQISLAQGLPSGQHTATIRAASGPLAVDSLTIRRRGRATGWLIATGVVVVTGLAVTLLFGMISGRRRWYERSRAPR